MAITDILDRVSLSDITHNITFAYFSRKVEWTILRFSFRLSSAIFGMLICLTACATSTPIEHATPRSIAKINLNSKNNICLTMMSFTETSEAFKQSKGDKVYYSLTKRYVKDIDQRSEHFDAEARTILHNIYQNPYDRELHRKIHSYCGESIFRNSIEMLNGYYKEIFQAYHFTPNWDM